MSLPGGVSRPTALLILAFVTTAVTPLPGGDAAPSAKTLAEHQKRRRSLNPRDAKQLFDLGSWCSSNGLKTEAEEWCRDVLLLEPDHAGARKALGYSNVKGAWLTHPERRREEERARLQADAARLPDKDIPALLGMAQRAAKAGFPEIAASLCQRVAAADPENARARRGLRQTRFEGTWQADDALRVAYVTAGDDDRRKGIAQALQASGSDLTPQRLDQHRRWASQPKGRHVDLPLEGKGYKTVYCLEVPDAYDGIQPTPLVVYLHGGGVGGVIDPKDGARNCARYTSPRGWISAFPKCPNQPRNGAWNCAEGEACVLDLVDALCAQYAVDPCRIYLAGGSMGGAGALYVAARHPDRFAAVGAASSLIMDFDPQNLAGLPVFLIHGEQDDRDPVEEIRKLDLDLVRLGGVHHYVELPGAGHNLPPEAHPQLFDWIGRFRLSASQTGRPDRGARAVRVREAP